MTAYIVQRLGTVMIIMVAMSRLVFVAAARPALQRRGADPWPIFNAGDASGARTQARFRPAITAGVLALGEPYAAGAHGEVVRDGAARGADAMGRPQPVGDPGGVGDDRRLDLG